MPSSPGYVRDYKQEDKTSKARGDGKRRAERNKARAEAIKLGMLKPHEKKDVDHIKPLIKGGSPLDPNNLRAISPHKNRSYKRTPGAGMA